MAPTLVASRTSLPPEGAVLAWGGPARRTFMTPTLAPSLIALRYRRVSPEGTVPAWGGTARQRLARV